MNSKTLCPLSLQSNVLDELKTKMKTNLLEINWVLLVIAVIILSLIYSMTYKVGAPIPITGVQFGMAVEFGYDCLIPADFNDDVSV